MSIITGQHSLILSHNDKLPSVGPQIIMHILISSRSNLIESKIDCNFQLKLKLVWPSRIINNEPVLQGDGIGLNPNLPPKPIPKMLYKRALKNRWFAPSAFVLHKQQIKAKEIPLDLTNDSVKNLLRESLQTIIDFLEGVSQLQRCLA